MLPNTILSLYSCLIMNQIIINLRFFNYHEVKLTMDFKTCGEKETFVQFRNNFIWHFLNTNMTNTF